LFDIPYFFLGKVVPPQAIVNEVLLSGCVDAGMSGGCKWKPFQLDDMQYMQLVADLKRRRFQTIQPPEWVQTHSDWHTWCAELVWGIPALENKRQWTEIHKLSEQYNAAQRMGDREQATHLVDQINQLCAENLEFTNKHRSAKPRLPLFSRPLRRRI
jgi:hypothetical protein